MWNKYVVVDFLMMVELYFIPACCSSAIHSHNPPLLLLLLLTDEGMCVCVCVCVSELRQCILSVKGHMFDPKSGQSHQSSSKQGMRRQYTETSHETINQ